MERQQRKRRFFTAAESAGKLVVQENPNCCDILVARKIWFLLMVTHRLNSSSGRRARAWIYFIHYNFVRIHQTLKITPAMAPNVTSKLWERSDLVKVLEDWEAANYGARPC